jgi:hypothetical protein
MIGYIGDPCVMVAFLRKYRYSGSEDAVFTAFALLTLAAGVLIVAVVAELCHNGHQDAES